MAAYHQEKFLKPGQIPHPVLGGIICLQQFKKGGIVFDGIEYNLRVLRPLAIPEPFTEPLYYKNKTFQDFSKVYESRDPAESTVLKREGITTDEDLGHEDDL